MLSSMILNVIMPSVILLNVIMLIVVVLNAFLLILIILTVIMLIVIMLNVVAPFELNSMQMNRLIKPILTKVDISTQTNFIKHF